ncbi:serine hydrolase [Sporolactobacillus shoreicorticis]|uniref:Serine hydrolase n=1 Tax=Sporolactobacillus shoreicorticis TaxID=1923877 RepID=A0ABW5S1S9_9BACL|nr:serine hydrolase domain-containing protein [Sporolactobacillus shoreicorticis]MCO7127846.1 serine hydrolase [Sporolactobacillus shoreicorticis]
MVLSIYLLLSPYSSVIAKLNHPTKENGYESIEMWLLITAVMITISGFTANTAKAQSNEKIRKIERFVEEQKNKSKIPGIALVIVERGKVVYQKGFGYADVKKKSPVTAHTLFEIGSTTKAFTGLAILQLEKEGLLKRSEDVRKYIPWLKLKYKGKQQKITLNQLLHHTSGIASSSITQIPESQASNALELTVKTLLNQPLDRKPGSSFEYATINYDVLGRVIEVITKQPYDVYVKRQVLEQAGMNESKVGLHQHSLFEMASGYKIGFMRAQAYTPPVYRGNVPAGYVISNATDLAKWLNLQLGRSSGHGIDKQIIQESHIPDQTVKPFDKDTYYAGGWDVMRKKGEKYIAHSGNNPTFSSYLIIRPDDQLGVAILSNMNSDSTSYIGKGVMDLWQGSNVTHHYSDSYQMLDQIVTFLTVAIGCFSMLFLLLSFKIMRKLVRKQRMGVTLSTKRLSLLIIHTLIVVAIFVMILFPKLLSKWMSRDFINVWGPTSITVLFYSITVASILYYGLGLLLIFTAKKKLDSAV